MVTNQVNIAASGSGVAAVSCPVGTQVFSGGGTASSFTVHLVSTFQNGNGWIVAYQNTSALDRTITAIASCATVTPSAAITTTWRRLRPSSLLPK